MNFVVPWHAANSDVRSIDWGSGEPFYAVTFKCGHTQRLDFDQLDQLRQSSKAFGELVRGLHCEECRALAP